MNDNIVEFSYNQNNIILRISYISFLFIVLILIITAVNLSTTTFDNTVKDIIIYDKNIIDYYRKAKPNDLNDYQIINLIQKDKENENSLVWYNLNKNNNIKVLEDRNTVISGNGGKDPGEINNYKDKINTLNSAKNYYDKFDVHTFGEIKTYIQNNNSFTFDEKINKINGIKSNMIEPNDNDTIQDQIDKINKKIEDLNTEKTNNETQITDLKKSLFTIGQLTNYASFYKSLQNKNLGNYVFLTEDELKQFVDNNNNVSKEDLEKLSENQRIYLSAKDPINNYIIGFSSVFLISYIISTIYLFLTISDYKNITSVVGFILTLFAYWITLVIEKNGQPLTEKDNQMIGNIIGWSMIPILIFIIFNRAINKEMNSKFIGLMLILCSICLSLIFALNTKIQENTDNGFLSTYIIIGIILFFLILTYAPKYKLSLGSLISLIVLIISSIKLSENNEENKGISITSIVISSIIFIVCFFILILGNNGGNERSLYTNKIKDVQTPNLSKKFWGLLSFGVFLLIVIILCYHFYNEENKKEENINNEPINEENKNKYKNKDIINTSFIIGSTLLMILIFGIIFVILQNFVKN